ncbi:hypothetical protein BBO99_00007155 [Phytophthora kernoviae]|uniref:RED-like N-terminal domain-containing protein n=2 Tax=Phytophthora kernoviae TaxID=325452 RepID=A0A3R7JR91_9STRA|nr:hypothetical protein G195_008030 [Phytophthora kernoviae 00238/432]KAG2520390.1 hypothetical protein JM16_006407 [Phytophthora kernoviae]KAG2521417.1 hypothetical protein JM18_006622 [Phytophthora kernoviae]RLN31678.1 hypothetical protein BBI17_007110 [Phytophthora kernoviae]RLN76949.1 hypothetical protein BBO99_00007155 [Phytophthora kernoviae]
MNQDDFRQMVASREASGDQHAYGGKRNLSETDLAEIKKLSKKAKKKGKKPKNAADDDVQAEPRPPKSSYRDRAAERRKGGTGDMINADEFAHLNAEQSKFLGGDMEHTHLVKGLDYALLAQLKREKDKLLQATEAEKHKHTETRQVLKQPSGNKLTFKSRMGRMYYTFNLSTDELENIPVSVQRSKEDRPEPDEVVSGVVDESLIDRVRELMNSKKTGGKKLRKKKKEGIHRPHDEVEQQEEKGEHETNGDIPPAPAADVEMAENDDDEDIFQDVGEYIPVDQRIDDEAAEAAEKESIKKTGYFSNLSAAITEKEEADRRREEDAERAWKDTLQNAVEKQKQIEREETRKAKEAKMTGAGDDYAEYQGDDVFGSDGEDDEETVRRRKAAGLTNRNADPETDKEEKVRRKKQKQSSKMANDLEKINKLMEDK